jgi:DNA gyrase subunit A
VIRRRSRHELEKAEAERHIAEGLLAALDRIDEVIAIIRSSRDRAAASLRLQDRLGISEAQAEAILNMRLARLTALEHDELRARIKALRARIKEFREILGSQERQLDILMQELDGVVERFGDARRTVLLAEGDAEDASVEVAMADEDVIVTVSHGGFVKRIPMHIYRRRIAGGKPLAAMDKYDEDYLERVFVARTQGWVMVFTRKGHVHFLPVLEVPEGSRASRGQSLYALVGANRGDPIVAVLPVDDLASEKVLLFLTRNGLMKRTRLAEYSNPRAGGMIAAGVKAGDEILDVAVSDGSAEVLVLSRGGRAIRFPEDQVPVVGRTAQGVKGMGLKGTDKVVGMLLVRREAQVLTVTDLGVGRRTPVDEFPLQNRGGLGILALAEGEGSGALVSVLDVVEGEDVMLVSGGGKVFRVPVVEIPKQSRRARGRRVVTLPSGDRVVEVTRASGPRDEEGGGGPEEELVEDGALRQPAPWGAEQMELLD